MAKRKTTQSRNTQAGTAIKDPPPLGKNGIGLGGEVPPPATVQDILTGTGRLKDLSPRDQQRIAAELVANQVISPSGEPLPYATGKTAEQLRDLVLRPSNAKDFLQAYTEAHEEGLS